MDEEIYKDSEVQKKQVVQGLPIYLLPAVVIAQIPVMKSVQEFLRKLFVPLDRLLRLHQLLRLHRLHRLLRSHVSLIIYLFMVNLILNKDEARVISIPVRIETILAISNYYCLDS